MLLWHFSCYVTNLKLGIAHESHWSGIFIHDNWRKVRRKQNTFLQKNNKFCRNFQFDTSYCTHDMMKSEYFCSCFLFWPDRSSWLGPHTLKFYFWSNLSNPICSAKPMNPQQKQVSPEKGQPTLLSLPEWVVLLTFRRQSRRGEFNGINLNLRLYHPQSWPWGHVEDQSFSHTSA